MTEETHKLIESMEDCSIVGSPTGEYIGRVNWFNKTKGYGFVTIMSDCEWTNKDIFLHFSNIISDNYKVVYPGEYISLDIGLNTDGLNKSICTNVRGVMGGKLLVDNEDYNYRVYQNSKVNGDHIN